MGIPSGLKGPPSQTVKHPFCWKASVDIENNFTCFVLEGIQLAQIFICSISPYNITVLQNDDDLYGGQRSSEVKCGKLCDMTTIFGQKNW